MSIADDTMCMHYTLERLGGIKTQTDLQEFMEEIRYNISVNDEHRELNPDGDMPDGSFVDDPDDFDMNAALDRVKRYYIERALTKTRTFVEAAKLLGFSNYQTMQNWMDKLGMDKQMYYIVVLYEKNDWHEEFSSHTLKEARQWVREVISLGCKLNHVRILNAHNQPLKIMGVS